MYGHTKMLDREVVTYAKWKAAKHVFTWFLRLNILESPVWTNIMQHNRFRVVFFLLWQKLIWQKKSANGIVLPLAYLNSHSRWHFCFHFQIAIFCHINFCQSRKRPLILVTLVTYGQLNFHLKEIQLLRYTTSHNLS